MACILHHPATVFDLAACAGSVPAQVWALARVQVRVGPSWALKCGDETIACGGYVAMPGGDDCEGWFMASNAAHRHMLAVVRAILLTGIPEGYRRRIVFVSTAAGRRIAALAGFRFIDTRSDGMEVWAT